MLALSATIVTIVKDGIYSSTKSEQLESSTNIELWLVQSPNQEGFLLIQQFSDDLDPISF